jgi:hypothetical protein
MEKDRPLELSEEDNQELLLVLFREWWLAATQTLVDQLGSSKALQLLAPSFRHHGHAGYKIMAKSLGWEEDDIGSIALFECLAKTVMSGTPAYVEHREDGVIMKIEGCRTGGVCREACLSYCYNSGSGILENCSQDMEFSIHESLSQGDCRCLLSIEKKGHGLPSGRVIRSYTPETSSIDEHEWDFWSRAGMGEVWAITTRAVVEGLGSEEAMLALRPHMQQIGISLGNRMKEDFAERGTEDLAFKAVALIQGCFGMEGEWVTSGTSGEISTCPFSGGSIEMCRQFETSMSGLCSAIDPSSKFAYDRMMTKGDKICHWTIVKKGEAAKEKAKEEVTSDDPANILAMRYARGELSEDEFDKKMAQLRKHGLVT